MTAGVGGLPEQVLPERRLRMARAVESQVEGSQLQQVPGRDLLERTPDLQFARLALGGINAFELGQDLPRLPWDIAFHIERNEWQGTVSPQIHVRAVRRAE